MKKSLTFIFAAALLVSCQQEENEATTPANSRITISPIITRATEVNFETGDKIGVTITQNGDFVYAIDEMLASTSFVTLITNLVNMCLKFMLITLVVGSTSDFFAAIKSDAPYPLV